MSRKLSKSVAAEADLVGIWLYSFENWGENQADRYLSALEAGIKKLLARPKDGKDRGELRPGYWSKRINRHVVFYTFDDDELSVRRVLHASWTQASTFER